MTDTSIGVSDEVWEFLNEQKQRGDSFDDVLRRELGIGETKNAEPEPENHDATNRRSSASQRGVTLPDGVPQTVDEGEARQAIQAVLEFLETEGGASQREIVGAVMPDHSLGYDVPELEKGDRYRGSWWRRVVKPGLELDDRVQKPATGESEWRWREDR